MEYIQVLLRARGYQLCWIPQKFAVKGKRLKIRGVEWLVKEVYNSTYEVVYDSNKIIWASDVSPLNGEKLEERKKLYKRLNQEIEEIFEF